MQETDLEHLIRLIAKLPGLGPRSAKRAVLHLLKNRDSLLTPLITTLDKVSESIKICETCGNLDTESPCKLCKDEKRDNSVICVVEEVADLWAFDRGGIYSGMYHVLGGTLSALDGRGPNEINVSGLLDRIDANVQEVIIATNATVDGQTTAHYLMEKLREKNVKTTRLAHGIPIGGELDYMDEGTLGAALKSRKVY